MNYFIVWISEQPKGSSIDVTVTEWQKISERIELEGTYYEKACKETPEQTLANYILYYMFHTLSQEEREQQILPHVEFYSKLIAPLQGDLNFNEICLPVERFVCFQGKCQGCWGEVESPELQEICNSIADENLPNPMGGGGKRPDGGGSTAIEKWSKISEKIDTEGTIYGKKCEETREQTVAKYLLYFIFHTLKEDQRKVQILSNMEFYSTKLAPLESVSKFNEICIPAEKFVCYKGKCKGCWGKLESPELEEICKSIADENLPKPGGTIEGGGGQDKRGTGGKDGEGTGGGGG